MNLSTATAPLQSQQLYQELVDALATAVFIGFIERGRASLSISASSMLAASYDFLQRTYPSPWPKNPETVNILKRDIQISLLDGLIREGMPGVRIAVMACYDKIEAAADKRNLTEQTRSVPVPPFAADLPHSTPSKKDELPVPFARSFVSTLPGTALAQLKEPTTYEEVLLSIRKAVSDHLNQDINNIALQTNFAQDLGADSLDLVELVMMLENRLLIEIKDDDIEKIQTVDDAVKLACMWLHISLESAQENVKNVDALTH